MIKDIFVLKKNSWHMSMMTYIWNFKYYNFSHICPYFWLSVFNVMIIAPLFIVKSGYNGIQYLAEKISDFSERKTKTYYINILEQAKTNPAILDKFINSCNSRYRSLYNYIWGTEITSELREFISEKRSNYLEMLREKENIREKEKRKRSIEQKDRINRILKFIKPISIVFLYILGALTTLLAGWGMYKLIILLSHIHMPSWNNIGLAALILTTLTTVVILGAMLWSYLEDKWCGKTPVIFIYIIQPFIWIFKGVVLLISFIIAMVKNNCPAIDWEE